MSKATTLEKAIFLFNPIKALSTPEELRDFYVDRGSGVRDDLAFPLRVSDLDEKAPLKILFTGHTGSGKSTEVNSICQDLEDDFLIVKVRMRNRPDVNYIDVLLKAALALFRAASDKEVIRRAPAQIASDVWNKVATYVEKKVYGDINFSTDLAPPSEFTAKINVFGVEFEGKYENEPETREKVRQANENQINEIVNNIDLIANEVRLRYGKPALFVFEDTDKLDPAVQTELFYDRGVTLTSFNVSAIFLMDISLRYSDKYPGIKKNFQECVVLPNVKVKDRSGAPNEAGRELLRRIVSNRLAAALIEDSAREAVVEMSGGHLRTLVALLRNASVNAAARKSAKIEMHDLRRASGRLLGDFVAELKSAHYPILKARADDKELSSDGEMQELLNRLALLEYVNLDRWCDVHPILLDEVIERTARDRLVEPASQPAPQPVNV